MILTTMCYIQKEKQTLLLHRVKKKTDINSGKWIGVGGKFETGESAEECMKCPVCCTNQALEKHLAYFFLFPI